MVIVLVAGFTKVILPHVQNMGITCYVIKQVGTKVFLYFDTDLNKSQVLKKMHVTISTKCGKQYAYQLYSLYNGMIDLNDYLPTSIKDTHPYYTNKNKDLSDLELTTFLKGL